MVTRNILPAAVLACLAMPATAEVELSFYGGMQTAPSSDISIRGDNSIADANLNIAWDGRPFEAPPYYGLRVTTWQSPTFGYGLDFTHHKVYPKDGELPAGYDRLEFTDGLNTLTANAYYRWDTGWGNITPYVGGGLGITVPHVEVITTDSRTVGFQYTGPAATVMAGARMPIADQWSVFGEYKATATFNTADLDSGGTLKADIFTNALNVGVSFDF